MKTSKILFSSFILLILILITAGMFSVKNKAEEMIAEIELRPSDNTIGRDTVMLDRLVRIELKGDGLVKAVKAERNSLIIGEKSQYNYAEGVLSIFSDDDNIVLNLQKIPNIALYNDMHFEADAIPADSVYLEVRNDGRVHLKNTELSYIRIEAGNDAEIELEDCKFHKAEVVLTNDADVYFINTECENLDFDQSGDADLRFRGKTKVGKTE